VQFNYRQQHKTLSTPMSAISFQQCGASRERS
jgi:hypothetical protein